LNFDLEKSVVVLERTPGVVRALLSGLPDEWTRSNEGPDSWSPFDVVGHLIDSASNNHQRFVRAVQGRGGEFLSYEQDGWVKFERPGELPLSAVLSLWSSYNRFLAHVLGLLPEAAREYTVRVGSNPPGSLLWLAADYVEHLKHHLNQVLGDKFSHTYPYPRS